MSKVLSAEIIFIFKSTKKQRSFLEIPFVTKHINCFELGRAHTIIDNIDDGSLDRYAPTHFQPSKDDLLDLDILANTPFNDVAPFIYTTEIRDAYIKMYGPEFFRLESEISPQHQFKKNASKLGSKELNETTIKAIALQLQSTMAAQLQQAISVILDQDYHLQEIAAELTYHAQQTEDFMGYIEVIDSQYKQCALTICFSLIRAALAPIGASHIVDVCESLSLIAELSERGVESIQEHLAKSVDQMRNIVEFENSQALITSEDELISSTRPRDIVRRWTAYRASVYRKSSNSIQKVWSECINSIDFLCCIIKQAAQSYPCHSQDKLLICASGIAKAYVADIIQPLSSQLVEIKKVRNAIKHESGAIECQLYFRRISLINYALLHEHSTGCTGRWISKKLGHQLSRYFPSVVFQKKWSPVWLISLINGSVKYAGEALSRQDYYNRKAKAIVVLNIIKSSKNSRNVLFETLEELIPKLSDDLVLHLKKITNDTTTDQVHTQIMNHSKSTGTVSRGRYSFIRRTITLFEVNMTEVRDTSDLSAPTL